MRSKKVSRKQFVAYERVRKSGQYNMIMDAIRAREATGLSPSVYTKDDTNLSPRTSFGVAFFIARIFG